MDVKLHVLPLAKPSKFVAEGVGQDKRTWVHCHTLNKQREFPVLTSASHLSMNFWKIVPLRLSHISTMYGCREDTNIFTRFSPASVRSVFMCWRQKSIKRRGKQEITSRSQSHCFTDTCWCLSSRVVNGVNSYKINVQNGPFTRTI